MVFWKKRTWMMKSVTACTMKSWFWPSKVWLITRIRKTIYRNYREYTIRITNTNIKLRSSCVW